MNDIEVLKKIDNIDLNKPQEEYIKDFFTIIYENKFEYVSLVSYPLSHKRGTLEINVNSNQIPIYFYSNAKCAKDYFAAYREHTWILRNHDIDSEKDGFLYSFADIMYGKLKKDYVWTINLKTEKEKELFSISEKSFVNINILRKYPHTEDMDNNEDNITTEEIYASINEYEALNLTNNVSLQKSTNREEEGTNIKTEIQEIEYRDDFKDLFEHINIKERKKLINQLLKKLPNLNRLYNNKVNTLHIITNNLFTTKKEVVINSGLIIGLNKQLNNNELIKIKLQLNYFAAKKASFDNASLFVQADNEKLSHAIKSAISAIMSRNMSHNLGSHVLSSLAYNTNMPYDDVILYKYLQHRMDFIAQITTDWPKWTYPVWFVRDLMRKFYTQTHLLNYIVESEDLSAYEFQNKKPGGDPIPDQKNKLIIEIEKYGLENKVITALDDSQDNRLNHDTDTQISIPGGTVGYHAFYVVLENIIRNTAKHEWSKTNAMGVKKTLKNKLPEGYTEKQDFKDFIKNVNNKLPENRDYLDATASIILKIFDKLTERKGKAKKPENVVQRYKDLAVIICVFGGINSDDLNKILNEDSSTDDDSISSNVQKWKDSFTDEFIKNKIEEIRSKENVKAYKILTLLNYFIKLIDFYTKDSKSGNTKKDNEDGEKANNIYWQGNKDKIIDAIAHNYLNQNLHIEISFKDIEKKNYTCFNIYSNIINPNAECLVNEINKKLKKGFIAESTGKLEHKNWGLAEIKIALGYLNKIDPIEIGRDNKDIILKDKPDKDKNKQLRYGLLKAKVVKDEYEDDYFGYEFIIPKPKEILIIDKEADKDLSDKLKKYNIHLTKDFNTKNLDYELVVVKDSDLIQKLQADDKLLSDFPSRVLLVTTDKIEGANKNRLFKISPDEYNTLTGIQNTEKADEFKFKLFSQWMLQYVSKSDERKSDEEEKSNKIYLHGETTGKSSVEGGYKIISKLIDQFYSIKNKYLLDNKEPFENKLKSNVKEFNSDKSVNHILNKYKQISKKMVEEFAKLTFTKYDEDIVTLPRAYRASKIASDKSDHGEKNDVFKRPILEDNIIYKNDTEIKELTEEQKNKLIYLKRHATLNDSYYYAEALSGAQSYFNLLINGNKNSADYLNQKVIVQLLENVFSGILIIDERVNEYYEHVEDDVKKQLRCANIFTYDDKKIGAILDIKKIIDVKSGVGKINDKEIKFLIIHQGIIDKLNEKDNVKIIDGLKQLQNIVPNVVITSGRGLPKDNLPEGFKFIPYSTIAETIMKPYHEKFLLTNILLKLTSYGK